MFFFASRKNAYINRMAVSQGEVLRQIDKVKEYAQKHAANLPTAIYNAMDGFSKTMLEYNKRKGTNGWASQIINQEGNPLWTEEEAEILQEALPIAVQEGGALTQGEFKFTPQSSLVAPEGSFDFSIDEIANSVKEYLNAIDEKNRQLASIVGPVAFIKHIAPSGELSVGPYPPYLPVSVPIPTNAILIFITTILESCRLLVSNNFFDIGILRKILSLVLSIYDVLRGEWKSGVLSFMGFFSQSWMVYGMIGKTARWVYGFMSPDIQNKLESDLFAGGKSMVIGFWLWVVSIVSPEYVRASVNSLLDSARLSAETLNQKISETEKQAQAVAASIGAKVEFPRIPLQQIPSFDDIQNFQTLVHQPEIYCMEPFQQALAPALTIPVLKLAIELLNIPTTPERLAKACEGQPDTVAEAITEKLKPTVVVEEPVSVKGGKRNTKRRSKKVSKRTRRLLR